MKTWRLLPVMILLAACVDRINFDTPNDVEQFVVEGMISNEPGPYTIYLSKSFSNRLPSRIRKPVVDAQIDLYQDGVKIDTYTEQDDGVYLTSPSTLGQPGHTYHIVVRTKDNVELISEPELLHEPGDFDNIRYAFQPGEPDVFNIAIDSKPADAGGYMRWRVNGIFRVISFPKNAIITLPSLEEIPGPLPCSGWRWTGFVFEQFGPCTCCECWITDRESTMHISDAFFQTPSGYRQVKVGEVKITPRTFYDKYRVEIEQLSVSENAHEFFRQVKGQADGVGSLFQPSFGAIKGNIVSNDGRAVHGLFWACGVTRQNFFLYKSDVPYEIDPIDTIPDNCNVVGEATYNQPSFW